MTEHVRRRKDMRLLLFSLLFWLLCAPCIGTAQQTAASLDYPLASPYYPVVLRADALPFLLNAQANWLSLFAESKGRLRPIAFQIDKVDKRGRYQFATSDRDRREEAMARIDANDELAFMVGDLGGRWSGKQAGAEPLLEVRLSDPDSGVTRWLYARVSQRRERSDVDYVDYEKDGDFIAAQTYRAGFSDAVPFLLDHLQRRTPPQQRWSKNLVDTMKVQHRGLFLHKFLFLRNHQDYHSRVTGVKDGPVRVIRRTLNNVRMIWFLNTPSIEVDFVAYANSFYVDTLLDIPFRIGSFFSELDTRFSIDWREDAGLDGARLYSPAFPAGLLIDGVMSPQEHAMNRKQDAQILFASRYGDMLVTLGIPQDLPITFKNFIQDDRTVADRPETIPGQFGNFGFLTGNWEAVNTELHHLMFHAYLTPASDSGAALEMLRRAPLFKANAANP